MDAVTADFQRDIFILVAMTVVSLHYRRQCGPPTLQRKLQRTSLKHAGGVRTWDKTAFALQRSASRQPPRGLCALDLDDPVAVRSRAVDQPTDTLGVGPEGARKGGEVDSVEGLAEHIE